MTLKDLKPAHCARYLSSADDSKMPYLLDALNFKLCGAIYSFMVVVVILLLLRRFAGLLSSFLRADVLPRYTL